MERWLAVLFSAFVPLALSFFVPRPVRYFTLGAAGALVLLAVILLLRQDRVTDRTSGLDEDE